MTKIMDIICCRNTTPMAWDGTKVPNVEFLSPMVTINMDNYKPYEGIVELRKKSIAYLRSLRGEEFSLEESNPNIKFKISNNAIGHLSGSAGETKLIITRQLPEIFKQGVIVSVENETKGDVTVDHILKCGTYIMLEEKVFIFCFVLKMKKEGGIYLYDGTIDIKLPEDEKTA